MGRFVLLLLLAGMLAATPAPAEVRRAEDAGLRYEVPTSWVRVPAPSDMRAAQYRIDGPTAGAADDAEVVLFFFGAGQGGGAQANLDRWYTQFAQPDGRPSRDAAVTTTRTVGALAITSVDVTGTYTPVGMGQAASAPRPNTRMFAAVIEGAGGPWFLRIVGPVATLEAAKADFDRLLLSLVPHR